MKDPFQAGYAQGVADADSLMKEMMNGMSLSDAEQLEIMQSLPNVLENPNETKFDPGVSCAQSIMEMMSMLLPPEAKADVMDNNLPDFYSEYMAANPETNKEYA